MGIRDCRHYPHGPSRISEASTLRGKPGTASPSHAVGRRRRRRAKRRSKRPRLARASDGLQDPPGRPVVTGARHPECAVPLFPAPTAARPGGCQDRRLRPVTAPGPPLSTPRPQAYESGPSGRRFDDPAASGWGSSCSGASAPESGSVHDGREVRSPPPRSPPRRCPSPPARCSRRDAGRAGDAPASCRSSAGSAVSNDQRVPGPRRASRQGGHNHQPSWAEG